MKKLLTLVIAFAMGLSAIGFTACSDKNTLVVYTEAGFAPFEYMSDGKIVGVDVDIMNLVGKKLGMKVQFENVGFDTIVDAVSAGKLCKVGAAGISITPDRQEKVAFSKEYYTATLYVIYEKAEEASYVSQMSDGVNGITWDKLAGKKIAVQGGTTADLFLGDELAEGGALDGTNATKTPFDSLATAVADVGLNQDVLIIDELPAKELIKNNASLACAPLYYEGGEEADEPAVDKYAICVTKGEDEILNAINEVIDELGTEGIQSLVNQHLGIEE